MEIQTAKISWSGDPANAIPTVKIPTKVIRRFMEHHGLKQGDMVCTIFRKGEIKLLTEKQIDELL